MDIIRLFGGGFPLTIERLEFLQQTYGKAFSQISKLAGSGKIIIDGTVITSGNVTNGALIIDGEIIEFRGGVYNNRVAIFEDIIEVPYNQDDDSDGDLDLKPSDVVRFAKCAASGGADGFQFTELKRIQNLQQLGNIKGEIKPFFGLSTDIPDGWAICDGNGGAPINGQVIPDLRGRSLVGTSSLQVNPGTSTAANPYTIGETGGADQVTIIKNNVPNYTLTGSTGFGGNHTHPYRDSYFIEASASPNDVVSGYGSDLVGNNFRGSGDTDADNRYIWYRNRSTSGSGSHNHSININSGGIGSPLENRSPFFAVNYLIFVGL